MKKTILLLLAIVVSGTVIYPISFAVSTSIVGSAHDFSITGPGTYGNWSGDRICIACHTPHNADTTVTDAPLWNHEVTTATYTLYCGTGTLDATDLGQPGGSSKLCLSCHDGTVALDSFGGSIGTTYLPGTADSMLDIGLEDDHPISFTYDTTLVITDGNLETPTESSPGSGKYEVIGVTNATGFSLPLFNSKLQCATCHSPHDSAYTPFLRGSNAGSALCLTCHLK